MDAAQFKEMADALSETARESLYADSGYTDCGNAIGHLIGLAVLAAEYVEICTVDYDGRDAVIQRATAHLRKMAEAANTVTALMEGCFV